MGLTAKRVRGGCLNDIIIKEKIWDMEPSSLANAFIIPPSLFLDGAARAGQQHLRQAPPTPGLVFETLTLLEIAS